MNNPESSFAERAAGRREGKTRIEHREGFDFCILENDDVRAVFLPEIGCKMTEFWNLRTDRQFLLRPQNASEWYDRPSYGADFAMYDTSGFDECFPTVGLSRYRALSGHGSTSDIEFPDHGEIWSRPWAFHASPDAFDFMIHGVRLPYEFEKSVRLQDNVLSIRYRLRNGWQKPLSYLWSAHPLLDVRPGSRILLPDGTKNVFLNWTSDPAMGQFGDTLSWPHLNKARSSMDFSIVQTRSSGVAVKCFSDTLMQGWSGVYFPEQDESLLFTFNPAENPYLGIWLCYGGWPESSERKHLTIALEPCSGRPDRLEDAVHRGECFELLPGEERTWSLSLSTWKSLPPKTNSLKSPDHLSYH